MTVRRCDCVTVRLCTEDYSALGRCVRCVPPMVSQRLGPEVISRDHVLRLRNGVLSPARLISGCPACHQGRLAEVAAPLIALMATSTAALQTGLQTGAAAEVLHVYVYLSHLRSCSGPFARARIKTPSYWFSRKLVRLVACPKTPKPIQRTFNLVHHRLVSK